MSATAYVDESGSHAIEDPGTYILAAAVIADCSVESVAEAMRKLLLPGAVKLHWTDESSRRQSLVTETIAGLPVRHLVTVRTGAAHTPTERRRRTCLKRLCWWLQQEGVDHMILESRGPKDDRRDMDALQAFRAQHVITSDLRMDHVRGRTEPLLWVPDAVCGAIVQTRRGTHTCWQLIEDLCEVIEVP